MQLSFEMSSLTNKKSMHSILYCKMSKKVEIFLRLRDCQLKLCLGLFGSKIHICGPIDPKLWNRVQMDALEGLTSLVIILSSFVDDVKKHPDSS
jgi:hypothetical protein